MDSRNRHLDANLASQSQHARVFELLPEYASLRINGILPGLAWHDLEEHLASCAICLEEFVAIHDTLVATMTEDLEPQPSYPEPDLSFLPQVQQPNPATRLPHNTIADTARRLFVEFNDAIVAMLRTPGLAGNLRAGSADQDNGQADSPGSPPLPPSWSYHPPGGGETDLSVVIETEAVSATPPLCRVLVTVDDPSDPIPERESEVTLQYDFCTLTATTHHGTVAFPDIPLDAITHMRITVVKLPL